MDSSDSSQFAIRELLDRISRLLNNTKARERMCRFFQYFGKFAKAWFKANPNAGETAEEWSVIFDKIGTSCAGVRKILRFGMEYPCLLRINDLLEKYFRSLKAKKETGIAIFIRQLWLIHMKAFHMCFLDR